MLAEERVAGGRVVGRPIGAAAEMDSVHFLTSMGRSLRRERESADCCHIIVTLSPSALVCGELKLHHVDRFLILRKILATTYVFGCKENLKLAISRSSLR